MLIVFFKKFPFCNISENSYKNNLYFKKSSKDCSKKNNFSFPKQAENQGKNYTNQNHYSDWKIEFKIRLINHNIPRQTTKGNFAQPGPEQTSHDD